MKAIADTGFLVAATNRHDHHHARAAKLAGQITDPLLTCEAVMAETSHHLGSTEILLRMVRQQLVKLEFDMGAELARLEEFAGRYKDRTPDLVNLCLTRMSGTHQAAYD